MFLQIQSAICKHFRASILEAALQNISVPFGHYNRYISPEIPFSARICRRYLYACILQALLQRSSKDSISILPSFRGGGKINQLEGRKEKIRKKKTIFAASNKLTSLLHVLLSFRSKHIPPSFRIGFGNGLRSEIGKIHRDA